MPPITQRLSALPKYTAFDRYLQTLGLARLTSGARPTLRNGTATRPKSMPGSSPEIEHAGLLERQW